MLVRRDAPADRLLKVMDAATGSGFLHVSHFAAHDRERFAEAPSETLLRAKLAGRD